MLYPNKLSSLQLSKRAMQVAPVVAGNTLVPMKTFTSTIGLDDFSENLINESYNDIPLLGSGSLGPDMLPIRPSPIWNPPIEPLSATISPLISASLDISFPPSRIFVGAPYRSENGFPAQNRIWPSLAATPEGTSASSAVMPTSTLSTLVSDPTPMYP